MHSIHYVDHCSELRFSANYDGTGPKNFQSPSSVDNQSGHSYNRSSSDEEDDDDGG